MSADDLDIRAGGVVAVDTGSLRAAAADADRLSGHLTAAAAGLRRAEDVLGGAGLEAQPVAAATVRAMAAAGDAAELAQCLRRAATVYEVVEAMSARDAAAAAGDDAAAAREQLRLEALLAHDGWAAAPALQALAERARSMGADLFGQFVATGAMGGMAGFGALLAWGLAGGVSLAGHGRVPSGARLGGVAEPVRVTRVRAGAGAAPAGLAEAASRIPHTGSARIRVEAYRMPGGQTQYAVYIAGTARMAQLGAGAEPFDMRSDLQLYSGQTSSSYQATLQALHDAGARPGDTVHAFGYSQGGMIAERLAAGGEYDVRTLVTFGSPVQAEVPDTTLSVALRHTDDPVQALADGGAAGHVGAAGSIMAERVADPLPGLQDLRARAHDLDLYRDTARMLDGSADPRLGTVRQVFAELGVAASVRVSEYAPTRTGPVLPSPGPSPAP